MEEIINTFHIDGKMILAQVINFAIVLFVFYKFGYQMLLQKMNERTEKIEKGLVDAKKATESLEQAEEKAEKELVKARKEAKDIVERARIQATEGGEKIIQEARKEANDAVEKAKSSIEAEKEKMLKEVKSEVGKLSVLMTEKILDQELDEKKKAELSEKALKDLNT
jgi:F-type H+-transporting ATPase subunit b